MSGQLGYRTTRAIVLDRDRACVLCAATERLTTHHRIPKRVIKINTPSNLVTLCERCHLIVEDLDRLTSDLLWWEEYHRAAAQIRADMQRGASIVERAQELLRQDGGAHGWSHALEIARQELAF